LQNKDTSLQINSELKDLFINFDKDKDGVLSYTDLVNGFFKILKDQQMAQFEADSILNKLQISKITPIHFSDFLKANVSNDHHVTDQKLRTAFNLFDIDGSGTIDN